MQEPSIRKARSLGLWRYLERYGEPTGTEKYLAMRKIRNDSNSIGRASKESLYNFKDIIDMLGTMGIKYYVGVPGNKEWYIFDSNSKRPFFYDLTIPALSVIIEYHGEAFHPNPNWHSTKWNNWKSLYAKVTADEQFKIDQFKKTLAESNGWLFFNLYSSTARYDSQIIYSKLLTLANSYKSSGN